MREGRVRGQGRRSPIVIWMQRNKVALERGFAETAPSWEKLAAYLGDHGITDGDGKRPTATATRQAWYRARTAKPRSSASAAPRTSVQPVADGGTQQADGERFTFATLRNHTPAPGPEPAAPPAAPAKRDAEAEIRRLLGDKPRRGFRRPEQED